MSLPEFQDSSRTRGAIVAGASWMLAFKATERSLGFVSTLILVRMLMPSDFGVVAMAMSIIAVLELLKSFSFDLALIQRHQVDSEHLNTAWTFNLAFGVFVSLLMLLLAVPASGYYSEPRLQWVIVALAAGWFVQSFENIGPVAFRRDLDFRTEYRFQVAKKVAAVMVTVPLAIWLRNYWALVIGMVVGKVFAVVISYWMHSYRPRLSLAGASDLMSFSGWLLVNNTLYFFNERLTDFVVGRMAGASALGLYNVSYEISNMPTTEIMAPINRVMLPAYSKISRDQGDLKRTYLDTVAVMTLASVPAGFGIAAVAEPLVAVLLGPRWSDAVPLLQILGIYGSILSLGTNTASAMLATGRQRTLTMLALARLTILIPAVIWATGAYGVRGTAMAMLLVTMLSAPVNFLVQLPMLDVRYREFGAAIWRPLVATLLMCLSVAGILNWLHGHGTSRPLLDLIAGTGTGFVTFTLVIILLWLLCGRPEGAESITWRAVKARTGHGR